ncbi:hypothetical protein MRX96_015700 [Rhipicephalus microplus]
MNKELSMLSSASRASIKRGKYVTISMAKKATIVKLVESGRLRADAAKEFQISKQTLLDYIKNKQKIWEAAEKSTGISNSMNGSEDDGLWEDAVAEASFAENKDSEMESE